MRGKFLVRYLILGSARQKTILNMFVLIHEDSETMRNLLISKHSLKQILIREYYPNPLIGLLSTW